MSIHEHHIVKDRTYGFRCLKCQILGDIQDLRAVTCTTNYMDVEVAEEPPEEPLGNTNTAVTPPSAASAHPDTIDAIKKLEDEQLAVKLMEEELECERMERCALAPF